MVLIPQLSYTITSKYHNGMLLGKQDHLNTTPNNTTTGKYYHNIFYTRAPQPHLTEIPCMLLGKPPHITMDDGCPEDGMRCDDRCVFLNDN